MPKILVIDYEHADFITISSSLKRLISDSYVASARSEEEGIEKAKSELPDVILLVTEIGDTDSFRVLERLKTYEQIKYIPVIILTGKATDPEFRANFAALGDFTGAALILAKSCGPRD